MQNKISPYGGGEEKIKRLNIKKVCALYYDKCGIDISPYVKEIEYTELRRCTLTGYKYWTPEKLSGNEEFYKALSKAWPNYYRTQRWEYDIAKEYINHKDSCLEIGCGRGYFLKSIENKCLNSIGLELNQAAISDKVCNSSIICETIEAHAKNHHTYNIIFSFQVLEHITRPKDFLKSSLDCLKSGGLLIISTPNDDWMPHQKMEDAFNLPPHHMGGYNPEVFKKIASTLEVELVSISQQTCKFSLPNYTKETEKSLQYRIFRRLANFIGSLILKNTKEPGHTVIAIFRKPAITP